MANNFYNQAVSEEGKGRFPGQAKYDQPVGGVSLAEGADTDESLEAYVEDILSNIDAYTSDTQILYMSFHQMLLMKMLYKVIG